MRRIRVKEEFQVPGTELILEAGDEIRVSGNGELKESRGSSLAALARDNILQLELMLGNTWSGLRLLLEGFEVLAESGGLDKSNPDVRRIYEKLRSSSIIRTLVDYREPNFIAGLNAVEASYRKM